MQWVSFALHMTESSSMGIRLWSVGAEITNLYGAQGKPSVVVLEKRRKLNRSGGFDTRDLILNRLAFRPHRPHRLPHRWLHRSALSAQLRARLRTRWRQPWQTKPVFWLHAFLDDLPSPPQPPATTASHAFEWALARCG